MPKPELDALCDAYRALRSMGFPRPKAWRLANRYLKEAKK